MVYTNRKYWWTNSKGIEIYSKDYFKDIIKYGYVDFQGKYDNYQVGHIEKNIYSLCRVKIIKGRKIQNDQEILINQKVSKSINFMIK